MLFKFKGSILEINNLKIYLNELKPIKNLLITKTLSDDIINSVEQEIKHIVIKYSKNVDPSKHITDEKFRIPIKKSVFRVVSPIVFYRIYKIYRKMKSNYY
ncbi:hypothetical protein DMUE_5802 [Dictyocoela muelleri]|nr:hypothetical protein DMUE_5802 [Dictyocoela muelleri]